MKIFQKLADEVHPIALGDVYRARTQIQMLAEKSLTTHIEDNKVIKRIISVLCSESGSHDYTINRREAISDLQLPIEKPDPQFYSLIKNLYVDIREELELLKPFNPDSYLGKEQKKSFKFVRNLIESVTGGSDRFITKGKCVRGNQGIGVLPDYEGWEHEQ